MAAPRVRSQATISPHFHQGENGLLQALAFALEFFVARALRHPVRFAKDHPNL